MRNIDFGECDRHRLVLLAVLVVLGLTGCNAVSNGIDEAHWTEEVKLHDGRTIVVERDARARHSGFPNASRGRDIDFRLRYAPMNLSWQGGPMRPLVAFEIFKGTPYLVLYVKDVEFCRHRDPKRYLAQFLRWQDGVWTEVEQSEFPADRALMNLYIKYWGHDTSDDPKGLVTWRDKAANDGFYVDRPYTIKTWFENFHRTCAFYQHENTGLRK